jgi:C1A family cysteine protease
MKLSVGLAIAAALVASVSATSVELPAAQQHANTKHQMFHSHKHTRAYYEDRFLTWMTEYGHSFSDAEYEERLRNFAASEDLIVSHNAEEQATFKMAHNAFSHMTWPEFKAAKAIGRPMLSSPNRPLDFPKMAKPAVARRKLSNLPKSINWLEKGGVTPVKNQGSCGSCWSFSSTGAMEGAYFVRTGELISLSEQMLVDCDTYDSGCGGGLMDYSFHWIQQNGGICAEDDYPYTGTGGVCAAYSCTPVKGTNVASWVDVESSMEALMEAVVQQPVSVAIEADEMSFQFYQDGVLTAGCGTNLDHGVLLVGYGTTDEVRVTRHRYCINIVPYRFWICYTRVRQHCSCVA